MIDISSNDGYDRAWSAMQWCRSKWGPVVGISVEKAGNEHWTFRDVGSAGKQIIFEFATDEMKMEFVLIWG